MAIAKYLGGGYETFLWAIDQDPYKVNVLFLACNRAMTSEALANLPVKDQPTREYLEEYRSNRPPDEDLAWSELFPQVQMYLADWERRRKEKERTEAHNQE